MVDPGRIGEVKRGNNVAYPFNLCFTPFAIQMTRDSEGCQHFIQALHRSDGGKERVYFSF